MNIPQRVHVGTWYILRAQRGSHIPTLRAKQIPYSYMDPLGPCSCKTSIFANTPPLTHARTFISLLYAPQAMLLMNAGKDGFVSQGSIGLKLRSPRGEHLVKGASLLPDASTVETVEVCKGLGLRFRFRGRPSRSELCPPAGETLLYQYSGSRFLVGLWPRVPQIYFNIVSVIISAPPVE